MADRQDRGDRGVLWEAVTYPFHTDGVYVYCAGYECMSAMLLWQQFGKPISRYLLRFRNRAKRIVSLNETICGRHKSRYIEELLFLSLGHYVSYPFSL